MGETQRSEAGVRRWECPPPGTGTGTGGDWGARPVVWKAWERRPTEGLVPRRGDRREATGTMVAGVYDERGLEEGVVTCRR